jgi:Amidohydrolase family
MPKEIRVRLHTTILLTLPALIGASQIEQPAQRPPNVAFINGRWFNGKSFDAHPAVYSVDGRFTFKKPPRVDRTLDLAGTWAVPPFGEAHNHSITGIVKRDKVAIRKFVADGVFYVKIQTNLPLSDAARHALPINRRDSVDVVLGQGGLTATGGWPIWLAEHVLLPQGYYPGHTKASLKDLLYFTIDSEAELEKKWPLILSFHPDSIKTFLFYSDEFEKQRNEPATFGQRGLDPRLLPKIVEKAHASDLRVSTHVNDAADFHNAVAAGVDEIAHLPLTGATPIAVEDAQLAARRGTVVITTCGIARTLPKAFLRGANLADIRKMQVVNLKLLRENGVAIAIGSDNVFDSSVKEIEYLQGLEVFDNLTLLKMWTETSAKTIFPKRKIGSIKEGFEASFLALEGNPLEDLQNVRKIKMRFKQGFLLEP